MFSSSNLLSSRDASRCATVAGSASEPKDSSSPQQIVVGQPVSDVVADCLEVSGRDVDLGVGQERLADDLPESGLLVDEGLQVVILMRIAGNLQSIFLPRVDERLDCRGGAVDRDLQHVGPG